MLKAQPADFLSSKEMARHIAKVRPDHGTDPASPLPVRLDLKPYRIDHLDQIGADRVRHGFEETPLVAEGVVIELEALEFDALATILGGFGLVSQSDDAEVWVPGDWAHTGKLLGDMLDHKGSIGWRFKDFKDGCIWHRPSLGASGQQLNPTISFSSRYPKKFS